MPSFRITIAPHRRAAARFISDVRRELQRVFSEEKAKRGLNQSEIARMLGVHRTVIHRELRGDSDLTLGRVAELAYALGRVPRFSLVDEVAPMIPALKDRLRAVGHDFETFEEQWRPRQRK